MDSENSPHVPSSGTSLLPKASRVTRVFDGKLSRRVFEPFIRVECGNGLFRGGNEIFVFFTARYLIP